MVPPEGLICTRLYSYTAYGCSCSVYGRPVGLRLTGVRYGLTGVRYGVGGEVTSALLEAPFTPRQRRHSLIVVVLVGLGDLVETVRFGPCCLGDLFLALMSVQSLHLAR